MALTIEPGLAAGNDFGAQSYEMSIQEFDFIRSLVTEQTGIRLPEGKREMVYSRLSRRIRALKLGSFSDYCDVIRSGNKEELVNLVNALTTNLTSFFRERHHFEFLRDIAIPELLQRNATSKTLRVWSAGCSTGMEPYSIAITLKEAMRGHSTWGVKVLATDIDTSVLKIASDGVYPLDAVKTVSRESLTRWFRRGRGENEGLVKVADDLRALISFRQLNLIQRWPMKKKFDIVFCRNVLIYFDKPTQARMLCGFSDHIVSNGYLFLGHSETLHQLCEGFKLLGNTVHRKI